MKISARKWKHQVTEVMRAELQAKKNRISGVLGATATICLKCDGLDPDLTDIAKQSLRSGSCLVACCVPSQANGNFRIADKD